MLNRIFFLIILGTLTSCSNPQAPDQRSIVEWFFRDYFSQQPAGIYFLDQSVFSKVRSSFDDDLFRRIKYSCENDSIEIRRYSEGRIIENALRDTVTNERGTWVTLSDLIIQNADTIEIGLRTWSAPLAAKGVRYIFAKDRRDQRWHIVDRKLIWVS